MKESILFLLLAILVLNNAFAQEISVNVGQATDNDYTKGEPAKFMYTNPSDTTESSYQIQGFVELGLKWLRPTNNNDYALHLGAELHKNTLIDKEQDVSQYGLNGLWIKKYFDDAGTQVRQLNTSLNIKYSEDREIEEESIQILASSTYYGTLNRHIGSCARSFFTPDLLLGGDVIQLDTDHNIGLAYLNQGNDEYMFFAQSFFETNFYLFPDFMNTTFNNPRTIFLTGSWNGRLNFENKTANSTKALYKLAGGIDINTYGLIRQISTNAHADNNKLTLTYEYVHGADPLKGFQDQAYQQILINLLVNF